MDLLSQIGEVSRHRDKVHVWLQEVIVMRCPRAVVNDRHRVAIEEVRQPRRPRSALGINEEPVVTEVVQRHVVRFVLPSDGLDVCPILASCDVQKSSSNLWCGPFHAAPGHLRRLVDELRVVLSSFGLHLWESSRFGWCGPEVVVGYQPHVVVKSVVESTREGPDGVVARLG